MSDYRCKHCGLVCNAMIAGPCPSRRSTAASHEWVLPMPPDAQIKYRTAQMVVDQLRAEVERLRAARAQALDKMRNIYATEDLRAARAILEAIPSSSPSEGEARPAAHDAPGTWTENHARAQAWLLENIGRGHAMGLAVDSLARLLAETCPVAQQTSEAKAGLSLFERELAYLRGQGPDPFPQPTADDFTTAALWLEHALDNCIGHVVVDKARASLAGLLAATRTVALDSATPSSGDEGKDR